MLWKDLVSFKKKFTTSSPPVCLILAKEPTARKQAASELLSLWKQRDNSVVCLDSESFTESRFFQEVETVPFLVHQILVGVFDIDLLETGSFETYLARPSEWVSLVLTASSLPKNKKLYQMVAEKGEILVLGEEKPWEKERKQIDWLVHRATESGVVLTSKVAGVMVRHLSTDPGVLSQELEKLICFISPKQPISLNEVSALCCKMPHETLWRLGEALFASDPAACIKIVHAVLEEGMAPFPVMAHLRTQVRNALLTLSYYQEGGNARVTHAFPYLKGGLLEKKLLLYQKWGQSRLQQALIVLFETELKAKTFSTDPVLLLELALTRLALPPRCHKRASLSL